MLVLGTARETVIWKFIIYCFSVQILHAKASWNPLSIANKIQNKNLCFKNSNYAIDVNCGWPQVIAPVIS